MEFNNGVYKTKNKKEAMFLAFNASNKDRAKYDAVMESLPVINGLKSSRKRSEAAYDFVELLESNGFQIKAVKPKK